MMSNWGFAASDSAATVPRPPGWPSFAGLNQQMGQQDEQFSHESEL